MWLDLLMVPHHWNRWSLGELVDVLDSRRVPVNATERAARTGSVPYYGATGQVGTIDQKLFDEPLVLLGEDGVQFFDTSKPKAYLIAGPAWVNNHAHVLRPRRDLIDDRYLMHFLNQADYRPFANGTTRLKLTQAAMREIPIFAPDVAGQRRIVDLLESHLSRLDSALNAVIKSEQCAVALKNSARAQLWTQSSAYGRIERLRSLGRITTGSTPRSTDVGDRSEGVPFVTPGDIAHGAAIADVARSVAQGLVPKSRLVEGPAILTVCIGATIGKVGWCSGSVAFNQQINCLEVGDPETARFVAALVAAPGFQSQIKEHASATTLPILNKRLFSELELPIPPESRRAQFMDLYDEQVSGADRLAHCAATARAKAAALRSSLLASALSGGLTFRTPRAEVSLA